jgi:hypothetical protein
MSILVSLALSVLGLAISNSANSQDYPEGMVSLWKFDEESGTIASDSVGGNDGTLESGFGNSPAWTTGTVGNALSFDGSGGYVEMPHSANLAITDEITIEAWIKMLGPTTEDYQRVFSKCIWELAVNNDGFWGGLLHGVTDTAPPNWVNAITYVSLNEWHHLAFTYSHLDSKIRMYIDGDPDAVEDADTVGAKMTVSTHSIFIGQIPCTWGYLERPFNGIIDEVAVYSRALTATEMQEHYQQGKAGVDYGSPPEEAIEDIVTIVEYWDIPDDLREDIKDRLENAIAFLEDDNENNDNGAIGQLNSVIAIIRHDPDIGLSEEEKAALIAKLNAIKRLINPHLPPAPPRQSRIGPRNKLSTVWGDIKSK